MAINNIVHTRLVTDRVIFNRFPSKDEKTSLIRNGFQYRHGIWHRTATAWKEVSEIDLMNLITMDLQ